MKKRPNHDGSIARWRDRWRGQYTDPVSHRQRSVYGKTMAECKAKLDQKLAEIRGGAYVAPDRITLGAWLDYWFATFYRPAVKPSTAATTKGNLRKIKDALGSIRLQKLVADDVQRFINDQLSQGLQVSTVKRYLKVLEQAMMQALDLGRISRSPMKGIRLPTMNRPSIQYLTREEQAAFLACVPSTTGGRALRLLLGTGLRVSELCGLEWRDVQADGLHVERTHVAYKDLEEDGYTSADMPPKTEAGRRVIPLTPPLRALLEEQRRQQLQERLRAGSAWQGDEAGKGSGYIFAGALGNPADRHNLNRLFRSVLNKAKLPTRGVHALRHTFATNWVQTNPDIVSLSRVLGHSDPAFTYKTYCHANQASMEQGMNGMTEAR